MTDNKLDNFKKSMEKKRKQIIEICNEFKRDVNNFEKTRE